MRASIAVWPVSRDGDKKQDQAQGYLASSSGDGLMELPRERLRRYKYWRRMYIGRNWTKRKEKCLIVELSQGAGDCECDDWSSRLDHCMCRIEIMAKTF